MEAIKPAINEKVISILFSSMFYVVKNKTTKKYGVKHCQKSANTITNNFLEN
jgi:hypothetical protein